MTVRPGRNTIRAAVVCLLPALAAFFLPQAAWLVLPVCVASIVLGFAEYRALKKGISKIRVQRHLPKRVGRDRPLRVETTIAGPAGLKGVVRDLVPEQCRPRFWQSNFRISDCGHCTLSYQVRIPIRGRHRFQGLCLSVRGKHDFLEIQKDFKGEDDVAVVPESVAASDNLTDLFLVKKQNEKTQRLINQKGHGMEFESLSEFRHGDDPHRIDWRTSVRHQRLIVRRFQVEQHRDILIAVDNGRLMGTDAGRGTKLDRAVDAALLLSRTALVHGDRCGVALFDDDVSAYSPPQFGQRSYNTISECLYDAQSQYRETHFARLFALLQARQMRRTMIIVISDMIDDATSKQTRLALASLSQRHVVLFAALRTPLLDDAITAKPHNYIDVSRQAVAMRLEGERARALHYLSRSNVQVLDVEPNDLNPILLNRYLDIRKRNLL